MDNFNKHLPKNIQEMYDPKLKRDRIDKEKLQRVYMNITRQFSKELNGKIKNIHTITEKDLEYVVEYLITCRLDKGKLVNLHNHLRGNYVRLATLVEKSKHVYG